MKKPLLMPSRIEKGRADELRDLWLRLLPEEKLELEALWPEMRGYWPTEWVEPVEFDEDVARLQGVTDRIRQPDDPKKTRKEALKRVMKWSAGREEL